MDDARTRVERWRLRAEELRAIADGMTDPVAQQQLRDAAAEWQQMAEKAARNARF
jgi:hypothetical protein